MDYSKFRKIKITNNRLDFWLQKQRNVLLIGKHGVGKTSIILDAFERNGLVLNETCKIFSGGTLDPWTDFIGIPKKVEHDGEEYLDYIRPKYMDEKLEAIFMDEYNRTNPKVRNALMELIQFKSINGKSFPNLKVVWAAGNPPEEDANYDVEEIDDAQLDRFHVIIRVPYAPDLQYFKKKYGKEVGTQAINWWKSQPEKVQDLVSPRRLDYAVEYFDDGGDIADILPTMAAINELKRSLKQTPSMQKLDAAIAANDEETIKKLINDENTYDDLKREMLKDSKYYPYLGSYLKEEQLSILISEYSTFFNWATNNSQINIRVRDILKSIYDAIEDESKIETTKLETLQSLFKYEKSDDVDFLVPNVEYKSPEKFSKSKTGGEAELVSKIDRHISLDDKNLKKLKNPLAIQQYWDKVSRYLYDPLSLSRTTRFKFLSFVDFACQYAKIETMPGMFEYVNALLHACISKSEFNEDIYYNVLSHYREKASKMDGFIIQEKLTLKPGDVPINHKVNDLSEVYGTTNSTYSNV